MQELDDIAQYYQQAIAQATGQPQLELIRIECLGKKGRLTDYLKRIGKLPAVDRPRAGAAVNQVKEQLEELLQQQLQKLRNANLEKQITQQSIDVTLPGRGQGYANLHPVTCIKQRIIGFFTQLGFISISGPEVEDDYYNFAALNIPGHHPARAMHDTFYFPDGKLLRTHTSPVQIRTMQTQNPPLRMIAPGRVYRCDSDQTHTPMFHQVEGLWVDEKVTFAELKGLLIDFLHYFFEQAVQVRFRPSYFPFTEPSAEVDLECVLCQGEGCRLCKDTGWIEVLGCGMVHPQVLAGVNVDPERFTGFAFGMGVDRLALLRYGISDLRVLFENDLRFLQQFSGNVG